MRFKGPRAVAFERARELNLRGITSDGKLYTCHECGSQWAPSERWARWPIRVRWSRDPEPRSAFAVWGAQIGADGPEQRVFARFIRLGPIVVAFGWREEYR
jgi:hypothetical protein